MNVPINLKIKEDNMVCFVELRSEILDGLMSVRTVPIESKLLAGEINGSLDQSKRL